jgi:predicted ATPase
MYSSCIKQVSLDNGDTLFTIIEQINHGVPSLLTTLSDQISVAQLNFQAGISTMNHFDFVGALMYLKIAASLLPTDAWKTLYGLSLKVNEVVVT